MRDAINLGLFALTKTTKNSYVYTNVATGLPLYVGRGTLTCDPPPDSLEVTIRVPDD